MKHFKYQLLALPILMVFFMACSAQNNQNKDENEELTASVELNKTEVTPVSQTTMVDQQNEGVKVKIKTSAGDMTIILYNETPGHQKNFIKLVKEKFYDNILFHRVIKGFMIQAGDPDSKTAEKGQQLGSGGPGYTIPAEFNSKFIHKKGALSAARTGDQFNPEKRSSGSQFYIVQGEICTDAMLLQSEQNKEMQAFTPLIRKYLNENQTEMAKIQEFQNNRDQAGMDAFINEIVAKLKINYPEIQPAKLTDKQKEIYKTIGGTPHLDGGYTVFGEVIEGLDIIDKIAAAETGQADRPVEDIKIISMELLD